MADDAPKKSCQHGDEIRFGPSVGDGGHIAYRHTADHQQLVGVVRPVREGENLTGNVFSVTQKDGEPGVFTVEDIPIPRHAHATAQVEPSRKPSKVNSPAFKSGWDAIFGKRQVGQA